VSLHVLRVSLRGSMMSLHGSRVSLNGSSVSVHVFRVSFHDTRAIFMVQGMPAKFFVKLGILLLHVV
jgi:hypothetical protein